MCRALKIHCKSLWLKASIRDHSYVVALAVWAHMWNARTAPNISVLFMGPMLCFTTSQYFHPQRNVKEMGYLKSHLSRR